MRSFNCNQTGGRPKPVTRARLSLKKKVKKEIFNMGSNGQQLIVLGILGGSGKVTISGDNQHGQP
jgi:hypothetical protein